MLVDDCARASAKCPEKLQSLCATTTFVSDKVARTKKKVLHEAELTKVQQKSCAQLSQEGERGSETENPCLPAMLGLFLPNQAQKGSSLTCKPDT
eukprot:1786138-Amphidinium_carterae.1